MAKQVLVELSVQDKQALARLREFDMKVFETLKKTDTFNKGLKGFFDSFAGQVVALNQGFELLGRAIQAFKKPLMDAAEAEVLEGTFAGTAQQMEMFRKATAGTVLDSNLIKLSNQARDLGLSMDQQAILFAAAEEAGDKYGVGVEEGFQKIVYASEGASRGLRELGIQKELFEGKVEELAAAEGAAIDALDAETQKRIRLQAILELTGITLDDVAKKESDSKDRLEQIGVGVNQLLENLGRLILNGLNPILTVLNDLLTKGSEFLIFLRDFISMKSPWLTVLTTATGALIGLGVALKLGSGLAISFIASIKTMIITLKAMLIALSDQIRLVFMYNPWLGWIVAAGALAGAIFGLTRETDKLNDAIDEEVGKIRQQQAEFNALIEVVKDDTKEKQAKNRAIQELNDKYGKYLNNIQIETATVQELAVAQAAANKEFERSILIKVADVRAEAMTKEMAGLYTALERQYRLFADYTGRTVSEIRNMTTDQMKGIVNQVGQAVLATNLADPASIEENRKGIKKLLDDTVSLYSETGKTLDDLQAKAAEDEKGTIKAEINRIDKEIALKKSAFEKLQKDDMAARKQLTQEISQLEEDKAKLQYKRVDIYHHRDKSDNRSEIEKSIATMREELRLLELRGEQRDEEEQYLVKVVQHYDKLTEMLRTQNLTIQDEIAIREERARLMKDNPDLKLMEKLPVMGSTLANIRRTMTEIEVMPPIEPVTETNLNMLLEYQQTMEDVRDAAREAGRAMAREIGNAAQVFRHANSLVETLINSFVELLVQMTAMRLVNTILNLIPGFKDGGVAGASEGQSMAMAGGGIVRGPGTGTSDSIPALLSNGEYVVNAKTARKYKPWLDYLNFGDPQRLALGGVVGGGSRTIIVQQGSSDVRVSVEGVLRGDGNELRSVLKQVDRLNKRIR